MKLFVALAALLGLTAAYGADNCSYVLEVKCLDDIAQGYKFC